MRLSRLGVVVVCVLVLVVVVAGCGGGGGDAASPAKVAFLSPSSANNFGLATKQAMERVAGERGAEITEFDAQFKAALQSSQLQDVITSGKYDGVVLNPADGQALVADVEAALAAGLKVAIVNDSLGERLDTVDPQVDGISVSAVQPYVSQGESLGRLTLQACEGKKECRVVYFYGFKGTALDNGLREGFDSVIAENPAIKVVKDAEGQYAVDGSFAAMQDVLTSTPELDVVVGGDQSMQGAEQALTDAGKKKVALIGIGGSEAALKAVKLGAWFGDVFNAPATAGELAMTGLLDAIEDGTETGGIDPTAKFPGGGLITKDNVDEYKAQWSG